MSERLQKFLAEQGLGSRRQIEEWIAAGRIQVDGVVAELGVQVEGHERIELDGQSLEVRLQPVRRRCWCITSRWARFAAATIPKGGLRYLPVYRSCATGVGLPLVA